MELIKTPLEGLWVIQPKNFEDQRGYFYESYNKFVFDQQLPPVTFLQDNQSQSQKDVLRGLHFQNPPFAQVKLIRVIRGSVLDVAVDIRRNSATYGKYFKIELSEHNKTMVWVPEGFAHGFVTLEDDTIFLYKCSNVYTKSSECCISWNDPDLNIDWEVNKPIISEKDSQGNSFKDYVSLF
jgi:dTDP-4-dehydrorhamnose 3,5-epimerase